MKLKLLPFLISLVIFAGVWSGCSNDNETTTVKDTTPPVTTAYPPGGTYYYPITVTLSTNEPATIFYDLGEKIPSVGDPDTLVAKDRVEIYIDHSTSLRFFAVDEAGNVETLKKEEYIIQPPPQTAEMDCQFTNPSSTIFLNNSKLPYIVEGIAWAKNTVVRVVKVSPDGGATWYTAAGTTNWQFQFDPDRDGDYQLLCKVGNGINLETIGTSSVHIIVDNVPPVVEPARDVYVINGMNSPGRIFGSASDEAPGEIDRVQLSRDGNVWVNAYGTTSWDYPIFLTRSVEGEEETFLLRAVDRAGNISQERSISILIDDVPPVIRLLRPEPWSFLDTDDMDLQAIFSEPVTVAVLSFDEIPGVWQVLHSEAGVTSLSLQLPVDSGFRLYNIVVTDGAGNVSNYTLPVYRSGIAISGNFHLFADDRFYLKPVTSGMDFYGMEGGKFEVVAGEPLGDPEVGTVDFQMDVVTPRLTRHVYQSGTSYLTGTIGGLRPDGKLYVEVFDRFRLADSVTDSVFYGLPVTYGLYGVTGTESEFRISLPDTILQSGVAIMAYEDMDGDGFFTCGDLIGYFNGAISSEGVYNFAVAPMQPVRPHVFIDGVEIDGGIQSLDLSSYSYDTTVVVTGAGCGGKVRTGLWFDDGDGTIETGEIWMTNVLVDGKYEDGAGDLDRVPDGRIETTLANLIKYLQFESGSMVFRTDGGEVTVDATNLREYNYTYTVEITDVETGNMIGDSYLGLISEKNGYVFTVKNGVASVRTIENSDLFPFLLDSRYILEVNINEIPSQMPDGMTLTLGARRTNSEAVGIAGDDEGKPLHGGFVIATPPCGTVEGNSQIAVSSIGWNGEFDLHLVNERDGSTEVVWKLSFGLPWNYDFQVTMNSLMVTVSTSNTFVDLGAVTVGSYVKRVLDFTNFSGEMLVTENDGARIVGVPLEDGDYQAYFPVRDGSYGLGWMNVPLPTEKRTAVIYDYSGDATTLSGKIVSGSVAPSMYYLLFLSPEKSIGFYVKSATDGTFSVDLPAGRWQILWGDSLAQIKRYENYNKIFYNVGDFPTSLLLRYYMPGIINISFDFPADWGEDVKEIFAKEPISGLTYSTSVTTNSGYISFLNMVPGSYIVYVVHNGNYYYYPGGSSSVEIAEPVVIDYKDWWKMIQFVVGE